MSFIERIIFNSRAEETIDLKNLRSRPVSVGGIVNVLKENATGVEVILTGSAAGELNEIIYGDQVAQYVFQEGSILTIREIFFSQLPTSRNGLFRGSAQQAVEPGCILAATKIHNGHHEIEMEVSLPLDMEVLMGNRFQE